MTDVAPENIRRAQPCQPAVMVRGMQDRGTPVVKPATHKLSDLWQIILPVFPSAKLEGKQDLTHTVVVSIKVATIANIY